MSQGAPLNFVPTPSPEDQMRAGLYGLIARLFYAAPDQQLLGELLHMELFGAQPEAGAARGAALARAWGEMIEACRNAFPVVLEDEHTELFVGTGKAEVTPYLSHYLRRHENDNPLVELRAQLAEWRMGRREQASEPEDHIAGVCEAMRFAIAVQQRPVEEQKQFFERFLRRGGPAFCSAVSASGKARFYQRVARFAQAFFDLEAEAFDMA